MKIEEPILMQHQNAPLNDDYFAQTEFKYLQREFKLNVAIETGTCYGYTTEFLASFYSEVRTVEISDKFLNIAKNNRLNNCKNVITNLGSSDKLMKQMLEGCGNDTFIFLDAHWNDFCPLKKELQAIADSGIEPVIAIHDFLVPNQPELGYDSTHGQPFTYEWLKEDFDSIYGEGNYLFYYNKEATGAKRGIIYVTPKK